MFLSLENSDLSLELKLGYRSALDKASAWKSLANASESRKLECTIKEVSDILIQKALSFFMLQSSR